MARNREPGEADRYRDPEVMQAMLRGWRALGMRDVYPHMAPARAVGALPPYREESVAEFLNQAERVGGLRVWPWIGGVLERDVRPGDSAWRRAYVADVAALLDDHPRLAGVHLNVEPWPTGNTDMLQLLEELRAAMPDGAKLSVAAYPPPTLWHPHPEVHWEPEYLREVAQRCDQVAVMMYDTSIRFDKFYVRLMSQWTREILSATDGTGCEVLLGLPAYEDEGVAYHQPEVENLRNGLRGVHAGLGGLPALPDHYRGTAVYSGWTMDDQEKALWRSGFQKP
ncbi:MAG: glycosyl hydrolase family 18 protein [Planctomycetota bacterium]